MTPYFADGVLSIYQGDVLDVLRTMQDSWVHTVVTSPPYWGLRDYGVEPSIWDGDPRCDHAWSLSAVETEIGKGNGTNGRGEQQEGGCDAKREALRSTQRTGFCSRCSAWRGCFGLEPTPDLYIQHAVAIFREVRRVLRNDGTLWLNMGDSYATGAGKVGNHPGGGTQGDAWKGYRGDRNGHEGKHAYNGGKAVGPQTQPNRTPLPGLKPKDLVGIPWMLAFALRADGWYLRQDIIWHKPNPMPECVRDRCTKAHEYLFLLSKSARYYYDAQAIAEAVSGNAHPRGNGLNPKATLAGWASGTDHSAVRGPRSRQNESFTAAISRSGNKSRKPAAARGVPVDSAGNGVAGAVAGSIPWEGTTRNKRSVWAITSEPFPEAHFATFPKALVKPCILAGCPPGGVVLDPFSGSGTTLLVAKALFCQGVGIELNPEYIEIAKRRLRQATMPLAAGDKRS